MMSQQLSEVLYIPAAPPARPFVVGDVVEVLDRLHKVLNEETIKSVGKRAVKTACGRSWTANGEWFDGRRSWPFPSIRLKP